MRYNNHQTETESFTLDPTLNTYIFTTVQIVNSASAWGSVFYHDHRDYGLSIEVNGSDHDKLHFQTGNDNNNVNQDIVFGTSYIFAAKVENGNVRSFTLYSDDGSGNLVSSATTTNSSFNICQSACDNNDELFIGRSDIGEYTNMRMGEFIYFQGTLPVSESSIINYLHHKWLKSGVVFANASSSTPTSCLNSAIANITHSTTGATGISDDGVAGANGLPAGVSASWSSDVITISGTPTAAGTFNYSIPLTGGCGSVAATGTIIVLPAETATFSYSSATYCETDSDPTPTVTGTSGGTFSATPSGLTINASTGAIDLDASSTGTYAVKYVTSSSICADSTTFNVTLTPSNTISVNGGFNISNLSHVQNFSIASQITFQGPIYFNNNGTKLFVLGISQKEVFEYNLTVAFNISSATYGQTFSVSNGNSYTPYGFTFNNDGTKMYTAGNGGQVDEYILSTGFDLSTASFNQSSSFSNSAQTKGIAFNNDGTEMFLTNSFASNSSSSEVRQYQLSTAFDISSSVFSQNLSINQVPNTPPPNNDIGIKGIKI